MYIALFTLCGSYPSALLLYISPTMQSFTLPDSKHHASFLDYYRTDTIFKPEVKNSLCQVDMACKWHCMSVVCLACVVSFLFGPPWSLRLEVLSCLMNYDIFREELAVKYHAYGHALLESDSRRFTHEGCRFRRLFSPKIIHPNKMGLTTRSISESPR